MAFADYARVDDFGDAAAEARACRTKCALFDFSFLECARLEGSGARAVIEAFAGRSVEELGVGRICYALRVGPTGQAIADLTIWRAGPESFDVMSGRREDMADLQVYAGPGLDVADVSADMATFSLQGPRSLDALCELGDIGSIEPLRYFDFGHSSLAGIPCRIGRLGYTGEAGFEIIVARRHARDLWQALSIHARPAGFIAADVLRIEAGFVLFSQEFRLPVSPWEAGLGQFYRSPVMPEREIELITCRADAGHLKWPWQPPGELKRPVTPGEIVVTSACESIVAGDILCLGYVLAGMAATGCLHDPSATFRNLRRTPMPFYDTAKRRPRAPWR